MYIFSRMIQSHTFTLFMFNATVILILLFTWIISPLVSAELPRFSAKDFSLNTCMVLSDVLMECAVPL